MSSKKNKARDARDYLDAKEAYRAVAGDLEAKGRFSFDFMNLEAQASEDSRLHTIEERDESNLESWVVGAHFRQESLHQ